jgi:hypothetical protein
MTKIVRSRKKIKKKYQDLDDSDESNGEQTGKNVSQQNFVFKQNEVKQEKFKSKEE